VEPGPALAHLISPTVATSRLKLKKAKLIMSDSELLEFKNSLYLQEGYLLHKSKVVMYISERINIEIVAMFKDCESDPFLRKIMPKLEDQMYTAKY